jgi:TRAP-type C4-dicarboxylate transport system permease large subunit
MPFWAPDGCHAYDDADRPHLFPVVSALGFDAVWFESSSSCHGLGMITPPVGLAC